MNTIEIKIGSFTYGADKQPTETAEIFIDGDDFCDRISEIEEYKATDTYYGHAPISIRELFDELTFWCKVPEFEKEAIILGCVCGVKECSPLNVKVEETDALVIWHSFSNDHMPEWKYLELDPLIFDRVQYYGELRKLRDAIRLEDIKFIERVKLGERG